ncbi:alpha/beta fold hydrolase [Nocardia sp. NPDC050710]|uniref:alpha/beta fold hydrolase n=1 Tax=Nocardia sp. NPDC050710 TaxID=3157220 RepID=UPI00340A76D6
MTTNAPTLSHPLWLPDDVLPYPIRALGDDDERIAFIDAGAGPVVLLVHVGMWSLLWRDLITELAPAFRCIAVDAPATGFSGGRPDRHATLRTAAERLTRVIEYLDPADIHLVCHDLGGPSALLAAGAWPDRIRTLTAVNTFAWRPSGVLLRGMLIAMGSSPIRGLDTATGLLPRLTTTRFGVGRHMDPRTRHAFRGGLDRRGRHSLHRYFQDAHRSDVWAQVDAALTTLADRPISTVFGEHNDPLRFQPTWRKRFPQVTQYIVPGGYHFPMCDAPGLVAQAIRTLATP